MPLNTKAISTTNEDFYEVIYAADTEKSDIGIGNSYMAISKKY